MSDPAEQAAEGWTPDRAIEEWRSLIERRQAAETAYEEQIADHKAAFEAEAASIDSKLGDIETWFLDHAETAGADAFASDGGTVTVSTRQTPKISEPDAFFTWAEATNNSALLQKRISVTEFRAYQKEHPDEVPPGVTVETTRSAKFKAAK
ncbi:MAG: hypothetical protein ACR2QK_19335 [Acidimicrobiales bacterium]